MKFTRDGKLVMTIGTYDKNAGSNDTTLLGGPAGIWVDPKTNEVFIADGYRNRRVIVFDGATGKYLRHWGAYGEPPDDTQKPANNPDGPPNKQFSTVHGITGSRDGMIYVADRRGNRIQVFDQKGKFIKEKIIAPRTLASGSAFVLVLSPDRAEQWLYMADGTNHKVWILRRSDLEDRRRVRPRRPPGRTDAAAARDERRFERQSLRGRSVDGPPRAEVRPAKRVATIVSGSTGAGRCGARRSRPRAIQQQIALAPVARERCRALELGAALRRARPSLTAGRRARWAAGGSSAATARRAGASTRSSPACGPYGHRHRDRAVQLDDRRRHQLRRARRRARRCAASRFRRGVTRPRVTRGDRGLERVRAPCRRRAPRRARAPQGRGGSAAGPSARDSDRGAGSARPTDRRARAAATPGSPSARRGRGLPAPRGASSARIRARRSASSHSAGPHPVVARRRRVALVEDRDR